MPQNISSPFSPHTRLTLNSTWLQSPPRQEDIEQCRSELQATIAQLESPKPRREFFCRVVFLLSIGLFFYAAVRQLVPEAVVCLLSFSILISVFPSIRTRLLESYRKNGGFLLLQLASPPAIISFLLEAIIPLWREISTGTLFSAFLFHSVLPSFIVMSAVWLLGEVFILNRRAILQHQEEIKALEPIDMDNDAAALLTLCDTSEAVQQYVSRVMAQGRSLVQCELWQLQALVKLAVAEKLRQTQITENREAYRKLTAMSCE